MWLPQKLKDLEKISPWTVLTTIVFGIALPIAVLLDRFQKLKGYIESIVLLGIQPSAPLPMKQGLTTWLSLTLLFLLVLAACFALLYVQAELRRRSSIRSLDEGSPELMQRSKG